MQREIGWTGWDHQGSERLQLRTGSDGIEAESQVAGSHDGTPWQLRYQLQLDVNWRLRRLSARLDDGRACHLSVDAHGQWWRNDRMLASLAGCIDIDIAATPFTNTLPIRRLGLNVGESASLTVALLSVPDLAVSAVRQRYTRLSTHHWHYEGLDSGFTALLEVDDQGLVLDYPDTFRRQEQHCMPP